MEVEVTYTLGEDNTLTVGGYCTGTVLVLKKECVLHGYCMCKSLQCGAGALRSNCVEGSVRTGGRAGEGRREKAEAMEPGVWGGEGRG